MDKVTIAERPDWRDTADRMGFRFHTIDGERYWDERAYYRFTTAEIDHLEQATHAVHEMCMTLVDTVANSEALMAKLAIPAAYHDLIYNSWRIAQPHLYGRMDFSYDGQGAAKLLELNYDTPTSLLESAAFQLVWFEERLAQGHLPAQADQFSLIAELMQARFELFNDGTPFHFSAIAGSVEDRGTTDFMRAMAEHIGIETHHIDVQHIGLNAAGHFVDMAGQPIQRLFKLHPWEHIFQEPFGTAIAQSGTQFVEPAWKAILSNKGILPMLWAHFPDHPNLLPAFRDEGTSRPLPKGWVRKPFFSREGANIELCTQDGQRESAPGPYHDAPYILQALAPLPRFGDSYTLIGSWTIGDQAAGISIREDDSLITKDTSRFLPHIIAD